MMPLRKVQALRGPGKMNLWVSSSCGLARAEKQVRMQQVFDIEEELTRGVWGVLCDYSRTSFPILLGLFCNVSLK